MKNSLEIISLYCEKVIIGFLLAIVVIVPLFFDIRIYSVFDLSKVTVLYLLTAILLAFWIILAACKQRFAFARTALDVPILAYAGVFIISTVVSINPLMSLFGTYKRFEGLTATVCYLFLFYATVNFITTRKRIFLLITAILTSAVLASCYGIAQHLGYDMFRWSSFEARRVFSTFGNPVFFSAYLVMTLPIATVLFFLIPFQQEESSGSKGSYLGWIFFIVPSVMYTAFWLTNTRACFVALLGGLAPLLFFIFKREIRKRGKCAALITVFVLIGIFFNLRHETSVIKHFTADVQATEAPTDDLVSDNSQTLKRPWIASKFSVTGSSFSRIFQYLAALRIIKDYPVLGIGPDTIGILYQKNLAKVYAVRESDHGFPFPRQDRIHNDILDITVTRGIIGLGTYVWLLTAFGAFIGKTYKRLNGRSKLLVLGLLAGIVCYLIQNEFSFGNTPIVSLFWVMLGLCIAVIKINERALAVDVRSAEAGGSCEEEKSGHAQSFIIPVSRLRISLQWAGCGIALAALGFATVFILRVYRADACFEYGRRIMEYEKENLLTAAEKGAPYIRHAIFLNPYETFYRDELCRTYLHVALKTNHETWIQKAYAEAQNTLRLIPEHFMGFFHLGMIHQFLSDRYGRNTTDIAIAWYEKAIDADPFQSIFHSNLASLYSKKGATDRAIEELLKAYLIRQDDLNTVYRLASAYAQKGDLDHALIFARKSVKLNPSDPAYYNNLGAILGKMGRYEEAIHAFSGAIEREPKEPMYQENLAKLYLSLGNLTESISCYEKLIDLNPSVADYHNNLGVMYQKEEMRDHAIRSFQKAIALRPDNPFYTYNLADTLVRKGQYAEAKQILQTFTKSHPKHAFANIHVLLAELYLKNADWDKVASECEQAIQCDEKSIAAYKFLSIMYYNRHQYELAEKTAQKTLALSPGDQEAQDLLVKISNKIRR